MNKLIICLMMGMFLITVVSAADFLGQQYEDITIIENCRDEGAPCDATYLCNITITDPFNNVTVSNAPMTREDTYYNFTLTDTNELGIYNYLTDCGNSTFSGSNEGTLEVTTTGKNVNSTLTIIILLVALVLFVIALITKEHSIGFISGVLFLLSGIWIMIYGLTYVSDMYTRAIAIVLLGFGLLLILTAGYEWLSDL